MPAPARPLSYCPATNTITVDLPGLQKMGSPAEGYYGLALQGDNTAYSVLVSRYMMALNTNGAEWCSTTPRPDFAPPA